MIVWDYTDAAVLKVHYCGSPVMYCVLLSHVKDIDFGTPIHNIAIRPGNHSKSLCLTLSKGLDWWSCDHIM